MKVELRNVGEIRPYAGNPRLNDQAVAAVAKSIREFGFRQPIVVDEAGVIVVGHTRWKAAQSLGLETVPVHVAAGLTADQVRAYRLADNRLAEIAEWDNELLKLELDELGHADFDLDLLGFGADELERLLGAGIHGNPGLTDPDAIPAAPDEAITKHGDLWLLGNHRLLCGDSASEQDVDRVLNGERIHLVHADAPYNVRVEPRSNNAISAGLSSFAPTTHHQRFDVERSPEKAKGTTEKLRAKDRPLLNDFVSDEKFDELLLAWFGNASRALEPGRAFYLWGGYANLANYPSAIAKSGLYFSQALVWNKLHPVLTRKDFMGAFELAFYGWKEGAAHEFFGPNNVPDLWEVKKLHHTVTVHLTEKPVELAVRAMQYSSRPGENVLDLFGGSGSTLIGAERTGRRAFLIELDPLYCDVIVRRYEEYSGTKAERIEGAAELATSHA